MAELEWLFVARRKEKGTFRAGPQWQAAIEYDLDLRGKTLKACRIIRLLEYNNNGEFSLVDLFCDDISEYAILSHRWGMEEVTLADLTDGTGKGKACYSKIRSAENRLGVTACNIFGWTPVVSTNRIVPSWQDATKCYVYLSDVLQEVLRTCFPFNGWESDYP